MSSWNPLAHTYTLEELAQNFESDCGNGLTSAAAKQKLATFGPNRLTPPARAPWWLISIFLRLPVSIFLSLHTFLLWLGALFCFIAYHIDSGRSDGDPDPSNLRLGVVLSAVAVFIGIVDYFRAPKPNAYNIWSLYTKMTPKKVTCTRDGVATTVKTADLVPGDVVDLSTGMAVPADMRVIGCSVDFRVDHTSMTGDPTPLQRDWRPSEVDAADSPNLCFFGTQIVSGSGIGMVIITGDNTFNGRVLRLVALSGYSPPDHPIAFRIKVCFAKFALAFWLLGIALFIVGMVTEDGSLETNVVFILGIVCAGLIWVLRCCLVPMLTRSYKNYRLVRKENGATVIQNIV